MDDSHKPLIAADPIGKQIFDAVDADDFDLIEHLIRTNDLIFFHEVNSQTGEIEMDDEGFNVMAVSVEGEEALLCFTDVTIVDHFIEHGFEETSEEGEVPTVKIQGNSVLDELQSDLGILLNATSEGELYFPPGVFEWDEVDMGEGDDEDGVFDEEE
ncbi:MAG TPA: hypothetical protein DDW52_20025 [Planctomycetaceae bacterium]|nr:hypothetical protein [Planctomycetaceae bacterium]